jgi:iron complex transport system ATP-binding protein
VILGGREILKSGSLSFLASGREVVGLLGPNGSGKSTLLRAICNLVKKRSGVVKYCGKDTSEISAKDLAKIFAIVSQSERFTSAYTVLESVVMGRYPYLGNFESYASDDYDRAVDSLRKVSLDGFENRVVTEISGGESARVVIARALAQDTPVLLLDEPTAALDPKHSIGIMRLMRRLADDGKIILAAIHDINLALEATDRLIFLKGGEIAANIKTDTVDKEILEEVYDIPWRISTVENPGRRFAFPI